MLIHCPKCLFKRQVNEQKIPPSAQLATCPKCKHKFYFREHTVTDTTDSVILQENNSHAMQHAVTEPSDAYTAGEAEGTIPIDTQSSYPDPPASATTELPAPPTSSASPEEPEPQNITLKEETITQENLPVNSDNSEEYASTPPSSATKNEPQGDIWDTIASMGGKGHTEDTWVPHHQPSTHVPWENLPALGIVKAFCHTVWQAAFQPTKFFPWLTTQASIFPAIVFLVIISLFSTVVDVAWFAFSIDFLRETLPPEFSPILSKGLSTAGIANTFGSTFGWIGFKLIFMAGIYHGLLRLVTPKAFPFSTTIRTICYSSAAGIASLIPYFGGVIGIIWFCFLTITGIKHAHNLSWKQTLLALTPFYLLCSASLAFIARVILTAAQAI